MRIQLLSCDDQRPDRRAITKMLTEIADVDNMLAQELTDILLDGTPVEIEVIDKTSSSAFRALRKLNIDYQIMD